jgi:ketosteroid isomerase-like protein
MKTHFALWLVASGFLVLSSCEAVATGAPSDIDTIKHLEQELGDATVAVDMDRLKQIFADDWESIGTSGKIYNKESALGDMKSGQDKLESFENGPMDVQVFGDVAVAQGSVSEKRIRDGKDASGKFVWMDLLKKRDGKWVIVRSLAARVA